MLRGIRPRGIAMLAGKAETRKNSTGAGAGYDYFQGYFFARPAIDPGRQIPPLKVACSGAYLKRPGSENWISTGSDSWLLATLPFPGSC